MLTRSTIYGVSNSHGQNIMFGYLDKSEKLFISGSKIQRNLHKLWNWLLFLA